MKSFPLKELEIESSKEEDDVLYELLKKLYKGKIYFGTAEVGFKCLLVRKSLKYVATDNTLRTVYDVTEYE